MLRLQFVERTLYPVQKPKGCKRSDRPWNVACEIVCSTCLTPDSGKVSVAGTVICPLCTARLTLFALPCDFYRKCHIQVMMEVWVFWPWGRDGMELCQTLDMLWKRQCPTLTQLRWGNAVSSLQEDQVLWPTRITYIGNSTCFVCIQAAPSQHEKHPSSPAEPFQPQTERPCFYRWYFVEAPELSLSPGHTDLNGSQTILREVNHCR